MFASSAAALPRMLRRRPDHWDALSSTAAALWRSGRFRPNSCGRALAAAAATPVSVVSRCGSAVSAVACASAARQPMRLAASDGGSGAVLAPKLRFVGSSGTAGGVGPGKKYVSRAGGAASVQLSGLVCQQIPQALL